MKRKMVILALGMAMCLLVTACGTSGTPEKKTDNEAKTEQSSDKDSSDKDEKSESEESKPEEKPEETKDTESEGETQPEETEESKPEETEEQVYNIGDSATLKDWSISVTDAQIVDSIAADYGSFNPNEEGNKFIQVFVTVNNNGKKAGNFLPSIGMGDDINAKVLYSDGYEFTATNLLGYSNDLHDSHVNPLSSQTGEIAFEIPESVASAEDELVIQFSAGNDTVKFKIRQIKDKYPLAYVGGQFFTFLKRCDKNKYNSNSESLAIGSLFMFKTRKRGT